MPAVALTDHGSLAGAVDLYKAAASEGVKPVLCCEVYVTDDRHVQQKGQAHLTLLASSNEGYANLIRLSSLGYLEGYYYKPRVDWQLLEQHGAGLIALSGCLSGRVCKALEENRPADAEAELDRLEQIFERDRVYVELQNAHLDVQQRINPHSGRARREARPADRGDRRRPLPPPRGRSRPRGAALHPVRRLAQEPESLAFETDQFYFKTPEEMAADFPGRDDALRRTLEVAERCNVEIELGRILLPKFDTPEGRDPSSTSSSSSRRARRSATAPSRRSMRERLKFELKTIKEMGFSDYFLIVADLIGFARRSGVSVGPGRGSSAGSLVAYCLEITDVDPIAYGLLFERMLNPGRKSMPDMDLDFAVEGRERVINYARERTAAIGSRRSSPSGRWPPAPPSATPVACSSTRTASSTDRERIPEGAAETLAECLKPGGELKQAYDSDPAAKEIVDLAQPLEGLTRQDGIHAAAVVIGAEPLVNLVPLQQKGADQEVVTQFSGTVIEAMGC